MTPEHQEIFRDLCTKVDVRSVLDAAIEHIAQLKADNKRLRDSLEPSEIDFSQLVAQEDEIKLLMARCAELEAENKRMKNDKES